MTKRQAREQRAAWQEALTEGRVVRYDGRLTSYPTIAARDEALRVARAAGVRAEIAGVPRAPEITEGRWLTVTGGRED